MVFKKKAVLKNIVDFGTLLTFVPGTAAESEVPGTEINRQV
ncbi:hypothetical protein [Bacillus sp. X1(2014)]|nr:hypothetical protein [Bacillus sp. X1(2014)]